MSNNGKRYSLEFKFRVVIEALRGEGQRTDAEVARAYGVHPVTLARWKEQFMDRGAEVFSGSACGIRERGIFHGPRKRSRRTRKKW